MQNQDEGPRYTDPGHPYSGSDGRYQNQYSTRPAARQTSRSSSPGGPSIIPFCIGGACRLAFIIMTS